MYSRGPGTFDGVRDIMRLPMNKSLYIDDVTMRGLAHSATFTDTVFSHTSATDSSTDRWGPRL